MKKIIKALCITFVVMSLSLQVYAQCNNTKVRLDADSFGVMGASKEENLFIEKIATYKKYELTNSAIGGQTLSDAWLKIKDEVQKELKKEIMYSF